MVELEVDSHADDLTDLVVQHVVRKPERGNIRAHEPTGLAVLLEDGDLVAERHEVVRHRERCGACADARHLLSILQAWNFRQAGGDVLVALIRRDTLEAADGNGLVLDSAATASGLAG